MKKKYLLCVFCILLCSLSLSSCKEIKTLDVVSHDYPGLTKLTAGELDPNMMEQMIYADYPYADFHCQLSLQDGQLLIKNENHSPDSLVELFSNGYFVGVQIGEYGGGLSYVPYFNYMSEAGEARTVAEENCYGIFHIDDKSGLALTQSLLDGKTRVWHLYYDDGQASWQWKMLSESVPELPETIFLSGNRPIYGTYHEPDGCLYFVDYNTIYKIGTDGELTELYHSELLGDIAPTSIVVQNNTVYIGSHPCIFTFDLTTEEIILYPMNYETYLKEKDE